jgi:hypothetical protein
MAAAPDDNLKYFYQWVNMHRIRDPDALGPKKGDPTDQDPEHLLIAGPNS